MKTRRALILIFIYMIYGGSSVLGEDLDVTRAKAEKGDAEAQTLLGLYYATGQCVTKNEVEAVKWYRKAAEQGDSYGQCALGLCYATGQGVTKNEVEAVKWYRKAAEQGNAYGQCALGLCYAAGKGVTKDEVEAAKWYRKAADQGYAEAQTLLGLYYATGQCVTKNEVEAVKWYRKAAEQGDATAQDNLGFLSEKYRHYDEALKWYRKAAEQGDSYGQCALGYCYAIGKGVTKDEVEAAKWFRRAAEQGNAYGQYNLAWAYYNGRGVPRNKVVAYSWINLAAAQADSTAEVKNMLNSLENELTHGEISEGQRLAHNFTPIVATEGGSNVGRASKTQNPNTTSETPEIKGSGTGFFISDDGYIVTNYHVVKDAKKLGVISAKGTLPANVVKTDASNDLAVLKVEGKFFALSIAPSRSVKLGDTVATVGFPNPELQGFSPKLSKGEIGSISGIADDARYFQISAAVQPGNSGGALVDERGNVVGIVSAKLSAKAALESSGALPENINYAVKSSYLLSLLESLGNVRLNEVNQKELKFTEVVQKAEQAAVLILVY